MTKKDLYSVKFGRDAKSEMETSGCFKFEQATVVHSVAWQHKAKDTRASGNLIICQVQRSPPSLQSFKANLEKRMKYIQLLKGIHEGNFTSGELSVRKPVWSPIEGDADKQSVLQQFTNAGAETNRMANIAVHVNSANPDDKHLYFHGVPNRDIENFVGNGLFDMLRMGSSGVAGLGAYGAGLYFSKSAYEAQAYAGLNRNPDGLIIAVHLEGTMDERNSIPASRIHEGNDTSYGRGRSREAYLGLYPDRLTTAERDRDSSGRSDLGRLHALRDAPEGHKYILTPLSRPGKLDKRPITPTEKTLGDEGEINTVVFSPLQIRMKYYITYTIPI